MPAVNNKLITTIIAWQFKHDRVSIYLALHGLLTLCGKNAAEFAGESRSLPNSFFLGHAQLSQKNVIEMRS